MTATDQAAGTPQRPIPSSAGLRPILKRADFLRAARALRQGTPGFLLQARRRGPQEPATAPIRFGLTCSKKLGNAVVRNRARRRLRALARAVLPEAGRPGWDYVLVGRPDTTVSRGFAALETDLRSALARLHKAGDRRPDTPGAP